MTTRRAAAAPKAETTATLDKLQELHPRTNVTTGEAAQVAAAAVAAAPATQIRRPWRSTVRTAFQILSGLLPMLPLIVDASGIDEAAPGVAGALAISSAVTRVMALPAVEQFLQRFAPFLAANPPAKPTDDTGAFDSGIALAVALGVIVALLLVPHLR